MWSYLPSRYVPDYRSDESDCAYGRAGGFLNQTEFKYEDALPAH